MLSPPTFGGGGGQSYTALQIIVLKPYTICNILRMLNKTVDNMNSHRLHSKHLLLGKRLWPRSR